MAASTHRVEVVPVTLEPHPNADTLSVVRIFSGYTCCVRTEDWQSGDLAAYVPPDSVVPTTRPEFAFLAKDGRETERIRVKKLRGIVSMGLLLKAPAGANVGDDLAEHFGVTHYEPPLSLVSGGEDCEPPAGYHPHYDVESLRRYAQAFVPGELVIVTEKIHGANGRFCCVDGAMFCGSRTTWKRDDERSIWWRALRNHPEIEAFCREHPDFTVYGEVYGPVQDLRYGLRDVHIAVFDLLRGSEWINAEEARALGPALPWVPVVAMPEFDLESILAFAEGPSLMPGADHVREGVVVKPLVERLDAEVGRVQLKAIGNGYLERA